MKTIKKIVVLLAAFTAICGKAQGPCNASNSPTFQVTTSQATLATNGICGMQIIIMNAVTNPTAGGPVSYSLFAPGQSSLIVPTPTIATIAGVWTVTVIDNMNTCSTSQTVQVTILQAPNLSVAASNTLFCSGHMATLTASGANNYLWHTGAITASISVIPATTFTYSVKGTSSSGCANINTGTINVNPSPSVTTTADQNSVCVNEPIQLTAQGADTYTWSTLQTGANITVTPGANTIYTVHGRNQYGCESTSQILVSVSPCTGVEVLKIENEDLKIFPVPAGDFIELKVSDKELWADFNNISIYNQLGQLIKEESISFKEQKISIRTDELANGIYSIQISNSQNKIITKKLLVAK